MAPPPRTMNRWSLKTSQANPARGAKLLKSFAQISLSRSWKLPRTTIAWIGLLWGKKRFGEGFGTGVSGEPK
jgi:hypothetical protein